MAVYYADDGSDDGVVLGRTSGKAGFFGTTPITRPTITSVATTTSTTTLLERRVARLQAALVALGIVAYS